MSARSPRAAGRVARGRGLARAMAASVAVAWLLASLQLAAAAGCGDGAVGLPSGEQCDDGNVVSGDGCSASCESECAGDQFLHLGACVPSCADLGLRAAGRQCVAACPAGSFNASASLCARCADLCTACTAADACTTCEAGRLLFQGSCRNSCPPGHSAERRVRAV
jgi:cysteine-rich repeat protein